MLSVRVQKDIGEYTEKIVGKLSARTLACLAGGLAAGFWRPHHMKFEKFVPLWLDFKLEDQRILYRSTPVLEGAQTSPVPGRPSRKAKRKAKRKGAEANAAVR